MTRIAPTRSTEVRADDVLVDARWRVGVRGSMTLSIVPGPERGAVTAVLVLGSERVVLAGRSEESDLEVRFTFEAVPERQEDPATQIARTDDPKASRPNGPLPAANRRNLRRLSGFKASVCHGASVDGGAPLFLTDLAQRLDLMGGTYVLESIRTGC